MTDSSTLPLACVSLEGETLHLRLGTDPQAPWVQGSMRVHQPLFLEYEYARRMLGGLLWLPSTGTPEGSAVHLGLGAGALVRFTRHALGMQTVAVDLNPHVIEACRQHFHVHADERLQIVEADAGAWLRDRCPPGSARLLFVDCFDHEVRSPVFDDLAFYRDCRQALRPDGVAAFNLVGPDADPAASLARLAEVFGASQVWHFPPVAPGHTIALAGRRLAWPDAERRRHKAEAIERRFGALGLLTGAWPELLRPWDGGGGGG